MTTLQNSGFYGTDSETYYTHEGRTWIVASEDDLGTQGAVEIDAVPAEATPIDHLLTPAEAIDHLRRIEAESGLSLIES